LPFALFLYAKRSNAGAVESRFALFAGASFLSAGAMFFAADGKMFENVLVTIALQCATLCLLLAGRSFAPTKPLFAAAKPSFAPTKPSFAPTKRWAKRSGIRRYERRSPVIQQRSAVRLLK